MGGGSLSACHRREMSLFAPNFQCGLVPMLMLTDRGSLSWENVRPQIHQNLSFSHREHLEPVLAFCQVFCDIAWVTFVYAGAVSATPCLLKTRSHNLTNLSRDAVAICLPFLEKVTA